MPLGRPRGIVSPCRFCKKQFKRVEHLRRHERIHTNEKPFACDHCGQSFARQDLLARHSRIAHQGISTSSSITSTLSYSSIGTRAPGDGEVGGIPTPGFVDWENTNFITPPIAIFPNSGHDNQITGLANSSVDFQASPGLMSDALDSNFDSNLTGSMPVFPLDSTNEFDLLWNYGSTCRDFLPVNFLDTNYPISQEWSNTVITEDDGRLAYVSPQYSEPSQDQVAQDLALTQSNKFRPLTILEAAIHKPNEERLPPNDLNEGRDSDDDQPSLSPWNILISVYEVLREDLLEKRKTLPPGFVIPSRHTLSRFLEGYFRGFHRHHPFLHEPTVRIEILPSHLLLSLAAAGAFYRFEHSMGFELYFAAKALVTEKTQSQARSSTAYLTAPISLESSSALHGYVSPTSSVIPRSQENLETIQTLVILMAISSWTDSPLVRDSMSISSQLGMLVREAGIAVSDEIAEGTEWLEWIGREVRRRTLSVAYIVFNLHSIAFDVPPVLLNQEIGLCLPHCGSEWAATSAAEFMELRRMYGHHEVRFSDVFQELLDGHDISMEGPYSALGNYVLISGLLQRIFLERHTSGRLSDPSHSLRPSLIKAFEQSLQVWQKSWESTQESSLDPSSSKGPLGIDAVAILRLAYIRLNANLGAPRKLISQDSQSIVLTLTDESLPLFVRSLHLDRAILQCVHALSVPVSHGITFVARTQALDWSIQVALSNLEAAFLLSRWLYVIAKVVETTGPESLREHERKLVGMTASLIKETHLAMNLQRNENSAQRLRSMGASIVRLWSETFKGPHVFKMVDTIGASLSTAAGILKEKLG